MKLMIVDDSLVIRNKINRALAKNFSTIVRASNGEEAVDLAEREKPEVVTMDLTMPHMDGVKCIGHLIERDSSIKILVISALADKATAIKALTLGANGFLCKPFNEQDLTEAIKKIVALKL